MFSHDLQGGTNLSRCGALSSLARAIAIEVLVHVEDKKRLIAGSRVFDVEQRRVNTVEPVVGVRVEVSGDGNGLRSGAGGTNRVDRGLDGGSPGHQ